MNITTIDDLNLVYIGWRETIGSADFNLWLERQAEYQETEGWDVPETIEMLDKYYADTKLKH